MQGHSRLDEWAQRGLSRGLGPLASRIARLEVFLSRIAADRGAEHKRCGLVAHMEAGSPVTVEHHAERWGEALMGASDKLRLVIQRRDGRLRQAHRGRDTLRRPIGPG